MCTSCGNRPGIRKPKTLMGEIKALREENADLKDKLCSCEIKLDLAISEINDLDCAPGNSGNVPPNSEPEVVE